MLFVVCAYHANRDFWIDEVETFFSFDEAALAINELQVCHPDYMFSIVKKEIAGTHKNFCETCLKKVDRRLRTAL